MASVQVAIIIPAFNEGDSIGNVIEELMAVAGKNIYLIVVNDCSSDNTGIEAKKSGAIVLDLQENVGYAQAIGKGMQYACSELTVDYLLTMDADGQHAPQSALLLIDSMSSSNADLIVGSRPQAARFSEWLYGKYFSRKFNISDPLCGLKIYRKSIYQKYERFETFDSIGTELLTWSLLKRLKVTELPVFIRDRKDEPRFGSTWRANKRIFLSLIRSRSYIKAFSD